MTNLEYINAIINLAEKIQPGNAVHIAGNILCLARTLKDRLSLIDFPSPKIEEIPENKWKYKG